MDQIIETPTSELELLGMLEETKANVDIEDIFPNAEVCHKFFEDFPQYLMSLWADNDRINTIVVKPGYSELTKNMISTQAVEMAPNILNVYEKLRDSIEYIEAQEEENLRIITFRQVIQLQEIISVHNWIDSIGIYPLMHQERGGFIQPTLQEMRMLYLIDCLLELRERNTSKIVTATSRLPNSLLK